MSNKTTIAFFGLGNMGSPMALNLLKNGYSLNIYDPVKENLKDTQNQGATSFDDPTKAVKNAQVVISMLPNSTIVEKLYSSLFEHLADNTLLIDCSTISSSAAKKVAESAQNFKQNMIDAPVSGGVGGAQAGSLTFIVGGKKEAYDSAHPILSCMGKNIFHAGDNGAGQVAKICNNMLLAIHMIGSSEALQLGIKNGLDPKVLNDIMCVSSGRNWSLDTYNPCPNIMETVPSSKEYQGGFASKLMLKDLGLAMQCSEENKAQTPLGKMSHDIYKEHCDSEASSLDFSSVFKSIE